MTNINQTPMNTDQKPKTSLVLLTIALVILALTGGYFFYARSLLKSSEVKDTDQISETAKKDEAVNDGAQATDEQESLRSTDSNQAPRDPDRYYNDEGGYSFIVPNGMQAKPADDVYPPDSIDSHNIVIDSDIPESVKTGGSDWMPEASIVTSDDLTIENSEYEKVQINEYRYLKKIDIIPEDQFWYTGEVYTYILLNKKKYIISGFNKNTVESTVNSFRLM